MTGTVSMILSAKGAETWTIPSTVSVFDAIKLMSDKNIGALPVVENGKLVGMLSERDYTRKVILKGKSSKQTPVADIMTTNPVVVGPSELIAECMRIMTEKRVRHLPVLDGGKMIGILSMGDAVKWIISAQTAAIDQLEKYITGEYPA
jgi:CBS domain-containing protein